MKKAMCNKCDWYGTEADIVSIKNEKVCPNCKEKYVDDAIGALIDSGYTKDELIKYGFDKSLIYRRKQ